MVLVGIGKKESLSENPVLKKTAKSNPCYYFDDEQDAFAYVKRRPVHLIVIDALEGLTTKIPFVRKLRRRGFYIPVAILVQNPKADVRKALRKLAVDLINPDQLQNIIDVAIETSKSKAVKGTKYEAAEIKRRGVDRSETEGKRISLKKDRDGEDTREIDSSGMERKSRLMADPSPKQASQNSMAPDGDKPEDPPQKDEKALKSDEESDTEDAEVEDDSDESEEITETSLEDTTEELTAESGATIAERSAAVAGDPGDIKGSQNPQGKAGERDSESKGPRSEADKDSSTGPVQEKAEEDNAPSARDESQDRSAKNQDKSADPNQPRTDAGRDSVPKQVTKHPLQRAETETRKEAVSSVSENASERAAGVKVQDSATRQSQTRERTGSGPITGSAGRNSPGTGSALDEKKSPVRTDPPPSPGDRDRLRPLDPENGSKGSDSREEKKQTPGERSGDLPKNSTAEFTRSGAEGKTLQEIGRSAPGITKKEPLGPNADASGPKTSGQTLKNDLQKTPEHGREVEKQGLASTQSRKIEKPGIEKSGAAEIQKSGVDDRPSLDPVKKAGLDRQPGAAQKPEADAKAPSSQTQIPKAGVEKDPTFTAVSPQQEQKTPQSPSTAAPSPLQNAQKPGPPVVPPVKIQEILRNPAPTHSLTYSSPQEGKGKSRHSLEGFYFMDFKGFPSLVMMQFARYAKIVLTRDIAYSHRKHLKAILKRGLSQERRLLGLTFVGDSELDKRILLHLARLSLHLSDDGITVCLYNCGMDIRNFLVEQQVHYTLRAFASEKEFESFARTK